MHLLVFDQRMLQVNTDFIGGANGQSCSQFLKFAQLVGDGDNTLLIQDGTISGHLIVEGGDGNDTVFDRFADAVLHGKTPTGITAEDARAVQRMQQDIIERGMRMGGQS